MSRLAHLIVHWLRHAQRLFHVLVGLVFLLLALAAAYISLGEWLHYRRIPSIGLLYFGLLAAFTVLLLILCLYSFVKARSIR